MSDEKPQPIGLKIYLMLTLPFDIAGFLTGAWIARSPEALAAFEAKIRSAGTLNVVSTNTPEAYRDSWWCYVAVCTVIGMIVGECVRPFIKKGPIY